MLVPAHFKIVHLGVFLRVLLRALLKVHKFIQVCKRHSNVTIQFLASAFEVRTLTGRSRVYEQLVVDFPAGGRAELLSHKWAELMCMSLVS